MAKPAHADAPQDHGFDGTIIDSKFPLNTSGRGLAFNHSGMFGMQKLIETFEQMRGTAGVRQVTNAKTI